MDRPNVRPNVITATTMIDALGQCKPSRIQEAKHLVMEFGMNGLAPASNRRVSTALIRSCVNSFDFAGIQLAYKNIHSPDTISFNAMIVGCCRCKQAKLALEAMAKNNEERRDGGKHVTPDVVTYTILISAVMKIGASSSLRRALLLYKEMKQVWGIMPDRALVDV